MNEDGTFELGEKLSKEDHDHLRARWDVTSLRRNATNLGVKPEDALRAEMWSYEEYESRVADASGNDDGEPDNPPTGLDADNTGDVGSTGGSAVSTAGEPSAQTLADASGSTTPANDDGPTLYAEGSPADKPYEEWSNDQLKAEIEARNEEFKDEDGYEPMSTSGTKAEMAARLREDDENE